MANNSGGAGVAIVAIVAIVILVAMVYHFFINTNTAMTPSTNTTVISKEKIMPDVSKVIPAKGTSE